MTTFVVASKANQPYLSECQILGEHLKANCPDVEVKFVIKDGTEWNQFIQSVCRSYGFVQKSSTVVYTLEGRLIGDGRNFIEYVREHFDTTVNVGKDQQKKRTALNIKDNDERMRKMKEGESLAERIEIYMEKAKKKKVAQLIEDCFYEEQIESGIPFQVRRSNFFRDMPIEKKVEKEEEEKEGDTNWNINRTMTVPDEELKKQQELQKQEQHEATRDRTYEEFEAMYGDHIIGKIDPATRVANRPVTAGFDQDGASRSGSQAGPRQGPEGEGVDGTSSKRERSQSKDGRSQMSRSKKADSKMSNRSKITETSVKMSSKYEILDQCKLQMLKGNKIETLDDDYILTVHPYPQMEGEVLLFQIYDKDQEDEIDDNGEMINNSGVIIYKDFSLMKRFKSDGKEVDLGSMTALEKKRYMEADQSQTRLQCLEISNTVLLSTADWSNFCTILLELQGLGWVQTLPTQQKSSQPMQFNMLHILPSSKIPFSKVPLDTMIQNKLNFQKKRDRRLKDGKDVKEIRKHKPLHEREEEAEDAGLVLLDEYPFEHAIQLLEDGELSVEGLKYGYKKICNFLGLNQNTNAGLTMIVAPQWMFIAPLYQPYHLETELEIFGKDLEQGVPLYHDGFAYAGILNLQDIIQVWPQTTGIGEKKHSVLDSLIKQSTPLPEPEIPQVQE